VAAGEAVVPVARAIQAAVQVVPAAAKEAARVAVQAVADPAADLAAGVVVAPAEVVVAAAPAAAPVAVRKIRPNLQAATNFSSFSSNSTSGCLRSLLSIIHLVPRL
jgi:hypothetical protein